MVFDMSILTQPTYQTMMAGLAFITIYCVYINREAITFWLTGDRKFHMDTLDFLNWIYSYCCWCCWCCCGDHTKMCTKICCCCCPNARQPLSTLFGSYLGLLPRTIEVSNIITGDLPFSGRGDFFITVESGSNPRQTSAVMRGGYPKVVHFRDRIIINVRDSMLEPRVVFHVWELNIAGSEKLCSVELPAKSLIHYADEAAETQKQFLGENKISGPKRFAMTPDNTSLESAGVPWISMTFANAEFLHDVEYVQGSGYLFGSRIRLEGDLDPEQDEEEATAGGFSCVSCNSKHAPRTTMRWSPNSPFSGQDLDMQDFKERVCLLDRDGAPRTEPREHDLSRIERCRSILLCIFHLYILLVIVGIMVYVFWRTRVWSCYRQFKRVTAAELIRDQFDLGIPWPGTVNLTVPQQPLTTRDLRVFWEQCQESIEGLDENDLSNQQDIRRFCAPTPDQVNQHCNPHQGDMSIRAFRDFAEELEEYDQWFGLQTFSGLMKGGLPCYPSVCQERNTVWVPVGDFLSPSLVVASLFSICCCRAKFNSFIHNRKLASGETQLLERKRNKKLLESQGIMDSSY
eukprot:TRINITY_DN16031_c1_g1_i1.p1 TRINITY_DN16031_c1_g1~~TRINITY_DN16031_c1_g1_i1.p1  ORF type:complete len:572 (+),score=63.23 TRINITY_DN16031_c1_g1_i1:102-1817(+)